MTDRHRVRGTYNRSGIPGSETPLSLRQVKPNRYRGSVVNVVRRDPWTVSSGLLTELLVNLVLGEDSTTDGHHITLKTFLSPFPLVLIGT